MHLDVTTFDVVLTRQLTVLYVADSMSICRQLHITHTVESKMFTNTRHSGCDDFNRRTNLWTSTDGLWRDSKHRTPQLSDSISGGNSGSMLCRRAICYLHCWIVQRDRFVPVQQGRLFFMVLYKVQTLNTVSDINQHISTIYGGVIKGLFIVLLNATCNVFICVLVYSVSCLPQATH